MKDNQLEVSSTFSFSSGAGINSDNQRSLLPPNPPTTRTPSLPPRVIGPLPVMSPTDIRRVGFLLRSFPAGADPVERHIAVKVRQTISRPKDFSTPPPTEGMLAQNTKSLPSGKDLMHLHEGVPLPSNPLWQRKETECNLSLTIEVYSIPKRTRHQTPNQLLLEAEGSRQQVDEKRQVDRGTMPAAEASKTVGGSQIRAEEGSVLPPPKKDHHTNQGVKVH